jgi:rubredoxin
VISLAEYESRVNTGPHGSGVACPECGAELFDDFKPIFIDGLRRLTCPKCKFSKVVKV